MTFENVAHIGIRAVPPSVSADADLARRLDGAVFARCISLFGSIWRALARGYVEADGDHNDLSEAASSWAALAKTLKIDMGIESPERCGYAETMQRLAALMENFDGLYRTRYWLSFDRAMRGHALSAADWARGREAHYRDIENAVEAAVYARLADMNLRISEGGVQ